MILPLALALGCGGEPAEDFLHITITEVPGPTQPDETDETDTDSGHDTDTTTQPQDTGSPPIDAWTPATVRINEVMVRNDSVYAQDDGTYADWFELFNPGPDSIDLATVTVDDGGDPWSGEGVLEPGAHHLVWADGVEAPFALSEGETLSVKVDGIEVDQLTTGPMDADVSIARFPDGADHASLTIWPTPGWTNGSGPGPGTDPREVLFQTDQIHDLELHIPESSWSSLAWDPYTEVPASAEMLGVFFPLVNVRLKGVWGSLRSLDEKAAFKVDLDDYENRSLRGVDDLTINNMVQDPTYVAELITYTLFREAGLPAPRVGYVRLFVNGELFGLYALVETPDEDFLATWYDDPTGPLFEGAYGVDFYQGNEWSFEYDEGPDENDRSTLTELATALDTSPSTPGSYAHLQTLVDMPQFLRVMGTEAITWHWDGYTTANNYRVYHEPSTDLFTMIPWGTDQTWTDEWYGPYDGYGRLTTWCLANPDCRADYNAALLEVADLLEATPLVDRMEEVLAFLGPSITDDEPRGEHSVGTHMSYVQTLRKNLEEGPDRIRGSVSP